MKNLTLAIIIATLASCSANYKATVDGMEQEVFNDYAQGHYKSGDSVTVVRDVLRLIPSAWQITDSRKKDTLIWATDSIGHQHYTFCFEYKNVVIK